MRIILLAGMLAVLLMPQPVEAARGDDRPQVSRSAPASSVGRTRPAAGRTQAARAGAIKAAPVKPQPSRSATRQDAPRQSAGGRNATRQNPTRQAALRPGDVRTQRAGIVVRGAAAATLPRGAASATRNAARGEATCTRRNGRTRCTPAERPLAWQAGLPSASNAQRDCPAGTMAALARGHNDIIRCMPL